MLEYLSPPLSSLPPTVDRGSATVSRTPHVQEERKLKRVPNIESDKEQSRRSRELIEEYIRRTGTQLWLEHDFRHDATLKKGPAYYE